MARPGVPHHDPDPILRGTVERTARLLVVALPTSEVDATTSSVARIVWVASGGSLVVLLLIACLWLGSGLRPLAAVDGALGGLDLRGR